MREVILDTETTGVSPADGHRVVEIGCIELIGGIKTGRFFHTYLNPQRNMPEEAYRVHGLSFEFLQDKPLFAEKIDDFLLFIADAPLVIHNAAFDLRFINAELERAGFSMLAFDRAIDTLLMARKKFPGAPASLDALCKRFNVDLSSRTRHGALLDAELLAEVYIELLGGRQVTLAFDTMVVSQETKAFSDVQSNEITRPMREFFPSVHELEMHSDMLKKLKNPVWSA